MRPEQLSDDDRRPDAWDAGWSARRCGSLLSENPFRGELGVWWDRGWLDGNIRANGLCETDTDDAGH